MADNNPAFQMTLEKIDGRFQAVEDGTELSVEDSLGDYLDSLKKVEGYPVKLALPGHRKPGDYHERIRQLLRHHERRLAEVVEAVEKRPGMTAYEIAGYMKWKITVKSWEEFPPIQQWFAVGECMAHIDYLLKRGVIRREEDAAGGKVVYHIQPKI